MDMLPSMVIDRILLRHPAPIPDKSKYERLSKPKPLNNGIISSKQRSLSTPLNPIQSSIDISPISPPASLQVSPSYHRFAESPSDNSPATTDQSIHSNSPKSHSDSPTRC